MRYSNAIIVTRHKGAVSFIAAALQGTDNNGESVSVYCIEARDRVQVPVVSSATADDVRGKVVYGNLPMHLAAEADTVYAIEFDGDPPRGAEYNLDDMRRAGARLMPYVVTRSDRPGMRADMPEPKGSARANDATWRARERTRVHRWNQEWRGERYT